MDDTLTYLTFGLAFATALRLRELGRPGPGGIVGLSPWLPVTVVVGLALVTAALTAVAAGAAICGVAPATDGSASARAAIATAAKPSRAGATARPAARIASAAAVFDGLTAPNVAITPSPVCLNRNPPTVSIAWRRVASCAAKAGRMASGALSHRRAGRA